MSSKSISEDMIKKLADVDDSLTALEDAVEEYNNGRPQYDQLSHLDKAKEDMATLFAINSCYWAYLRFKGKNPADDAELAVELNRNREYMKKIKHFDELVNRPKYDGKTVGRFVKHALFDMNANDDNTQSSSSFQPQSNREMTQSKAVSQEQEASSSAEPDIEVAWQQTNVINRKRKMPPHIGH